jgi:hypothetical protein
MIFEVVMAVNITFSEYWDGMLVVSVFMLEVFKINLFMCVLCRSIRVRYTGTRNNVFSLSDSQIHQHRTKISLTEFSKSCQLRGHTRACRLTDSVHATQDSLVRMI